MQDNTQLRNKYPEFVYESYNVERSMQGIHVKYIYKLGEHTFAPTVNIPVSSIRNGDFNIEFLEYLFFNFGIINAINYYKLTCAPKLVVKAGPLDDGQKEFFKTPTASKCRISLLPSANLCTSTSLTFHTISS